MAVPAEDEGVALADISSIEKLTSLNDISRLLHETVARERGLEAELDQLLSRRGELEQNLLSLHASSREVSSLVTGQFLLTPLHSSQASCMWMTTSTRECIADTRGHTSRG